MLRLGGLTFSIGNKPFDDFRNGCPNGLDEKGGRSAPASEFSPSKPSERGKTPEFRFWDATTDAGGRRMARKKGINKRPRAGGELAARATALPAGPA